VWKLCTGHVFLVEAAESEDQVQEQFQQRLYVNSAGHSGKLCTHVQTSQNPRAAKQEIQQV
jgi:hypothetical protein